MHFLFALVPVLAGLVTSAPGQHSTSVLEGAALLHYCAIALLLSCVRTPAVGAYKAAALSTQILSLHTHSHNLWDAPPYPTLLLSALIILSLPSKKEHSGVNYSLRS